jgi:hypothetical protein
MLSCGPSHRLHCHGEILESLKTSRDPNRRRTAKDYDRTWEPRYRREDDFVVQSLRSQDLALVSE